MRLCINIDHIATLREARGGLCLLYTSDAADERSSVDLGGRRIIKKNTHNTTQSVEVLEEITEYQGER